MLYERLTIPVLPRLKVNIRIVSGTYNLRVRFNTRYLWIGWDWVSKKMDPCPTGITLSV